MFVHNRATLQIFADLGDISDLALVSSNDAIANDAGG